MATMTSAPPDEAALRAQLAALEEQLAVARMQKSLSQMQSSPVVAAEPEGEYQEVPEQPQNDNDDDDDDDDDDDEPHEEIIVIEEIIEDGEDFEEVVVVEEEVYDDDEYEEYVEDDEEEEEMVEVYEEEIVDDSVKTEEDDMPFVPVKAFEANKARDGPPPQVPLIDPPREQAPAPPAPVPAGPPPPGPPQPVPAREAGPKNAPSALAANKANEAAKPTSDQNEPKPRKKWIPMSQRFPEKFKSKNPAGQKALAAAAAPPPILGAQISKNDKPQKVKPLPWRPKSYPTVEASAAGKETPMEKLLGSHLLKNVQMQKITVTSAVQNQGLVCLYFGAAWRKECKPIHQQLIDFYRLVTKEEKIEFVYVSADRTLFEFKDIFQKFDFLAMPTGTTTLKNALTKALKIVDMPVVAVFDVATGHVVTADAASEILDWPNRDKAAALALVQSWKGTKAVPMDKLKRATKASSGGQVKKGNLIWS